MSDTDRRAFLRGGLRAALATGGGLLLPWQGGGALALPDLAETARVPVSLGPLPVIPECLELRRIKEKLLERHLMRDKGGIDESQRIWRSLHEEHERVAHSLYSKRVTSWSEVVAMAEIAWCYMPKEENRYFYGEGYTGRLAKGYPKDQPRAVSWVWGVAAQDCAIRANANLIEAVLSLGGGERFDPKMGERTGVLYG